MSDKRVMATEDFVALWNTDSTASAIADQLGMSRAAVSTWAYQLRKRGYTLVNKNSAISHEERQRIGAIGGSRKVSKGFAMMTRARHLQVSHAGGSVSRRGPA